MSWNINWVKKTRDPIHDYAFLRWYSLISWQKKKKKNIVQFCLTGGWMVAEVSGAEISVGWIYWLQ